MNVAPKTSRELIAHQLISIDHGKFVLNQPVANFIREIKNDLGIITVAGAYRTGKSYILNRLLGQQSGFVVGPTINTCTKGIYIWGQPISINRQNDKPLNVILVDTEGISSLEKDDTYDTKIFSVAIFISSFLIYNSMNVIDEHSLDSISFFAELSNQLCAKDEELEKSQSPKFLWLLRDFTLQLVNKDGKQISASEYLENALKEQPTSNPAKEAKNKIRSSIKKIFPIRDCFTMPRPVIEEKHLQNIGAVPESNLRPEFLDSCTKLVEIVFSQVQPKVIKDKPLNGSRFMDLLEYFLQQVNEGIIPTIKSSWESLLIINNKTAFDESKQQFEKTIEEHFGVNIVLSDVALKELKLTSTQSCLKFFSDLCYGDNSELRKELIMHIRSRLAEVSSDNQHRSKACSKTLIKQCFEQFDDTISNSSSEAITMKNIMDLWQQKVIKVYFDSLMNQASEKAIYRVFIEFVNKKFNNYLVELFEKRDSMNRDETAKRVSKLELELRLAKSECENALRVSNEHQARSQELKSLCEKQQVSLNKYKERKMEIKQKYQFLEQEILRVKNDNTHRVCELEAQRDDMLLKLNACDAKIENLTFQLAESIRQAERLNEEYEEYKTRREAEFLALINAQERSKKIVSISDKNEDYIDSSHESSTTSEDLQREEVQNIPEKKIIQKKSIAASKKRITAKSSSRPLKKVKVEIFEDESPQKIKTENFEKDSSQSSSQSNTTYPKRQSKMRKINRPEKETDIIDPSTLSIRELQRILLDSNVVLPTNRQPKSAYLKLYNDNLSKISKNKFPSH